MDAVGKEETTSTRLLLQTRPAVKVRNVPEIETAASLRLAEHRSRMVSAILAYAVEF